MFRALEMIATIAVFASIVISGITIMRHLLNYTDPTQQLYIVRILLMIPAYAIQTWLSMKYPSRYLWYNAGRDIYEAYVLYTFMQLLIFGLGGEKVIITHFEMKRRIRKPWPFHNYKYIQTDQIFFRRIKQGVLQFVIIKPITAVLAIVTDHFGFYDDGSLNFKHVFVYV